MGQIGCGDRDIAGGWDQIRDTIERDANRIEVRIRERQATHECSSRCRARGDLSETDVRFNTPYARSVAANLAIRNLLFEPAKFGSRL